MLKNDSGSVFFFNKNRSQFVVCFEISKRVSIKRVKNVKNYPEIKTVNCTNIKQILGRLSDRICGFFLEGISEETLE